MFSLLDGNTEFFDVIAWVLLGDTLELYMFIICLVDVLRMSIDQIKNGFIQNGQDVSNIPQTLWQTYSRWIPAA